MNRRTILATAGAITLVVVTGAAAAAANVGLLGSAAGSEGIGSLTPASAISEPQTVIVGPAPAAAAQPTTAVSPGRADKDHSEQADDDSGRSDDGEHPNAEDAHEHYEGSDDDD